MQRLFLNFDLYLKVLIDGLRVDRVKDNVNFHFKIFQTKELEWSLKFLWYKSTKLIQESQIFEMLIPPIIDCTPILKINADILVQIIFAILANWRVILVGKQTTHIISSLLQLLSPIYFSHYIIYTNIDKDMIMYLTCPIMFIAGMTE